MSREFFPERGAEKNDTYEAARTYCEQLAPRLKDVSFALENEGFPVDEQCRIKTHGFQMVYPKEVIAADERRVEAIDRKIATSQSPEKQIGELLEMTKTIAVNELWFGKRFAALRTAKYDDYVNGVDEIVIDKITNTPVVVIDTTTNWETKIPSLKKKITEGITVKYGIGFDEQEVTRRAYERLPLLILSLRHEELMDLASQLLHGKAVDESKPLEKLVLELLVKESRELSKQPSKIQSRYQDVSHIFESIKAVY